MNFHNIIYETHYLYCFILMSLISGMLGMCVYIYVYIHKSFMTFKLLQGISIAFLLLLFLLIIVGV